MLDEYEVLNYVYKTAKMGKDSTDSLLTTLKNKDNKIVDVVMDILNSYESFLKRANSLLKSLNEKGKGYNPFATISADMGIKMKMFKDNRDAAVADM